MKRCRPI